MLSEFARPYIEASIPVLKTHGLDITRTFYRNMFAAHPELTNLFNMGNQAAGKQQQSLASAVFAYAANIDNPAALAPVIERIVHKHAAVGITAAQYPIVGNHLLGAIKETLGDAATPELLKAWEEAYGLLADALITEEKKLYEASGVEAGELRPMTVYAIQKQSALVKSFILSTADGAPLTQFSPGQYVSVAVDFPEGKRQLRQYSLSDASNASYWRISVKKEQQPQPGQVSHWLHEKIRVGDTLMVSQPFGDFRPDLQAEKIVLLSAGVGITPMISVLNQLAKHRPQAQVLFAHAALDAAHHAHVEDVNAARQQMPGLQVVTFHEKPDAQAAAAGVHHGRMQVSALPLAFLQDAQIYLCGPLGFMQEQWRNLLALGVPQTQLHREVFGPDMLDHLL